MFVFNIVCVCVCLNYTWGLDWLRMHLMYCAIPVWCNCLVVFLQVIQVEFCVRAWQIKEIPQMILMCMHVYLSFVRCVWVYAPHPPQYGCVSTSPDLRLKTVCSHAAGSRPRTSPDGPCEQSAPLMNTADARSPKHAHSPRDRSSILTRWSMGKLCLKFGVWDLLFFFRLVLLIWMKSAGVWWCACAWPLTIDPCLSVCVELSRLLGRRAGRKAPVSVN